MTKSGKLRASDYVFIAILFVLAIVAFSATGVLFYYSYNNIDSAISMGAAGDFVGGFLNPILTSLTFGGVLLSLFLQRVEMFQSRMELERSADALEGQINSIELSNFESSFFQMMSTLNSIINSVDLYKKEDNSTTKGRDCYRVFYTRLNKIYRENIKKSNGKHSKESVLRLSYSLFWKENQLELGHYYRYLYNMFRFLDNSKASKPYHGKLLRAQLSDQELLLLYYNCLSEQGRRFQEYAIKYEIFDNLPTVRLLEDSHIDMMDKRVFGNNPMYNSKTARMAAVSQ